MMLGPVELDAARYPWPGQSDQGGLDDVVPVEEVVSAHLVVRNMNTAPEFREDHQSDPFILEVHGLPPVWSFVLGDAFVKR